MIELQDINLTLSSAAGPVNILKGISLNVVKGETVGLIGPSGSGKSTLLMIIAGLEAPTHGEVMVADKPLTTLDEDSLALFRRDHIGIVFQSFHLVPTMTAIENVALPLELAGEEEAQQRAHQSLKEVGLEHRVLHYPSELSGGEQQRIALARALITKPPLILADEPTGNLDAQSGEDIVSLLFDLCRKYGTTLVLVTHDMALAEKCNRRVHLKDGCVVKDDSAASQTI